MQAVVVSAQRSGGLWLAGCLSNHPDIHCLREEPFRRESIWQQKLKLSPGALLDFVLSEPFYRVSMCRLTYDQVFHPEIREYLIRRRVPIVHLTRAVIPTVTSTLLAKLEMANGIPRHDFTGQFQDTEVLDVEPEVVVQRIKHLLNQRKQFLDLFAAWEILHVHYETLLSGTNGISLQEAARICEFLGVPTLPSQMTARNQKMHKRPIPEYYRNWAAISRAVRDVRTRVDLWR